MSTHKRKQRSAEEAEDVSRKAKKERKAAKQGSQPVKGVFDPIAARQAELDRQEEEAKRSRIGAQSPLPGTKVRHARVMQAPPSSQQEVKSAPRPVAAPQVYAHMEDASSDSESTDSSAEEDGKVGGDGAEKPAKKQQQQRPRVYLAKSAMETLVNPATHAYLLQPADLECSRQLRMFAIAARREKNSPYVKNGSIEVETADGKVFPLPVNGRNAPRYPGAAALRGRVLLASAQKAGVHAASSSFFKDFGFGAKTAIQLLKQSGQNVRDAEQEKKELHSLLNEGVQDLAIQPMTPEQATSALTGP